MRTSLVLFALGFTSVLSAAEVPCGNPVVVSQAYLSFQATVLDVTGPVTLLVTVPEAPAPHPDASDAFRAIAACFGQPCKVRLVNLDPPERPSLAAAAQRSILNHLGRSKRVILAVSPVQDEPGAVNALIYPKHYKKGRYGMEELLLERGLATYRSFGPYAVDGYSECRQKLAAQRAKDGRHGVWFVFRNP